MWYPYGRFTNILNVDVEIEKHLDVGCHVTSLIQGRLSLLIGTFRFDYEYDFGISTQLYPQNYNSSLLLTNT